MKYAALLLLVCFPLAGRPPAAPQTSDVFISGTGGYHTYRIPALLVTKKGTVLAFCEGRKSSARDDGDIDLLLRRSTDQGRTWSPVAIVYEEGGSAPITIGNPSPVQDGTTGTIYLLFARNNQRMFLTRSRDEGQTWTSPAELTEILRGVDFPWTRLGVGPGHGIQVRGGRLLVPIWLNDRVHGNYRSAAVYSDDGGRSWKAGGIVPPDARNANECMIFARSDGAVGINLRSAMHQRWTSLSRDGGATWMPPAPIEGMPDPVCQASILALPGAKKGRIVFANAADERKRINLTIRLSEDDGANWPAFRLLHAGPSAYSDLAATRDGSILCLYEGGVTNSHEKIWLTRISPAWLLAK